MTAKSYSTANQSCDRSQPARTPPSTFLFLPFNLSNSTRTEALTLLRKAGTDTSSSGLVTGGFTTICREERRRHAVDPSSGRQQRVVDGRVIRRPPRRVNRVPPADNCTGVTLWTCWPAIRREMLQCNALMPVHNLHCGKRRLPRPADAARKRDSEFAAVGQNFRRAAKFGTRIRPVRRSRRPDAPPRRHHLCSPVY
jgi:hypothetical protein